MLSHATQPHHFESRSHIHEEAHSLVECGARRVVDKLRALPTTLQLSMSQEFCVEEFCVSGWAAAYECDVPFYTAMPCLFSSDKNIQCGISRASECCDKPCFAIGVNKQSVQLNVFKGAKYNTFR